LARVGKGIPKRSCIFSSLADGDDETVARRKSLHQNVNQCKQTWEITTLSNQLQLGYGALGLKTVRRGLSFSEAKNPAEAIDWAMFHEQPGER
jgi:hypothetical protein